MSASPRPEIEVRVGALCIGDLHLDASDAACAHALRDFLGRHRTAPALVILGDLFEAWVGPAHARLVGAQRVLATLREWTSAGRALHLIPGNRDFLLGADFEAACGARVHPRGALARSSHERALLIHGDELCTLDVGYQRLKRILRSAPMLALAPRLPSPLALAVAKRLRTRSVRAVAAKPSAETAQQPDEVRRQALAAGVETVLCGHAHAFRDEQLPAGPRWVVVDAFGGARDVAVVGEAGRWVVGGSRGDRA
ncbi:MAG: UDP-2,3-diacylglucosamine diphosphatase [Planctomycetes bacterium]|nr:UDP-2,3-diacylglucosamine diphosphatase [Planctomycetota bacterium]